MEEIARDPPADRLDAAPPRASPSAFAEVLMSIRCASFVVLFGLGCSQSVPAMEDAAIVFEIPDSGTDAGAPEPDANVGAVCASDTDCGAIGICFTAMDGYPDGYCSAICLADDECPTGAVCIVQGGMGFCLDECDPAAVERECRAGYGCASGFGIPAPVCVPGCTDDTDCPTGRTCNPEGGGRCFDPSASFGDPCVGSTDCPDGGRCYSENRRGYPGGMCVVFGCDPAMNTGCPDDFQCIPGGMSGFGRCIDGCAVDADCRAEYACLAAEGYPDRLVCTPACTSNDACSEGRRCDLMAGTCG